MKVILTCETGFPLLRLFGKTELVSLSQLPRLLRLGVATEVEFLRELLAIPDDGSGCPLLTQLTSRCLTHPEAFFPLWKVGARVHRSSRFPC